MHEFTLLKNDQYMTEGAQRLLSAILADFGISPRKVIVCWGKKGITIMPTYMRARWFNDIRELYPDLYIDGCTLMLHTEFIAEQDDYADNRTDKYDPADYPLNEYEYWLHHEQLLR